MATKIITGVKVPGVVGSISTAEWDYLLGEMDSFWNSIGFVRTSDTGQVPLTGWVPPLGGGYEIRRFKSGALQTARPIFVKIKYGPPGNSTANGGITIQVGTGSDGVGNLTGRITTSSTAYFGEGLYNTAGLGTIYLSGDGEGYVSLVVVGYSSNSPGYLGSQWLIERTVDRETGLPTSEGFTMIGGGPTSFTIAENETPSGSVTARAVFGPTGTNVALRRVTMVPGGVLASPSFVDQVSLLRVWSVDSQGPLPLQSILAVFASEHTEGSTFKVANVGPVKHTYRVIKPPNTGSYPLVGVATHLYLLCAFRWE